MNGNFKARCVNARGNKCYTSGKVYEIINGRFIDDGGTLISAFLDFKTFEDLVNYSSSTWEEVKENQTIIIYPKGNEVIATIKEGKKVVKSAKATCNPSDIFDFEFGAKLAFQRLFGIETASEVKPFIIKQDKYKVGDKVKVREDLKYISRTTDGTLVEKSMKELSGKIVEITENVLTNAPRYYIKGNDWCWTPEMFEGKVIKAKPEPFRKAKVGDKIRVVNVKAYHSPTVKNGEILVVKEMLDDHINTELNAFFDKDEEYIIIEESKPVNRVSRKAEIGEWIKVIDSNPYHAEGDIEKVVKLGDGAVWTNKDNDHCISDARYIVLENYKEATK